MAVLPARPAWVIAARSLRNWVTDPRYTASLLVVLVAPFLMLVPMMVIGGPMAELLYWPLPVLCMLLGWQAHNDAGFDGTAIWQHLATGRLGLADRIGRVVPVMIIGTPVVFAGTWLTLALAGTADRLPMLLGLSIGALLVALGVSSFFSAQFPYPTPEPGSSPFSHPQASGGLAALIQFFSLFTAVALSTPVVVVAVMALNGQVAYADVLFVGLANGVVVLVAGVLAGAASFDRWGYKLLQGVGRV